MHISEFDFDLPDSLIAQRPAQRRDQSRLFVLRRDSGAFEHHLFSDLPELLSPHDLLILNDTRVVAARLVGRRARTEGKWDGLFVRVLDSGEWELLVQTRGRLLVGENLIVEAAVGELKLTLIRKTPEGRWLVRPQHEGTAAEILARFGQIPIPPYIRKGRADEADVERYQTIFARSAGAVAAPTAGLHFTPEVFDRLQERGIVHRFVTLHVGPGTFQPVKVEDVRQHQVEGEWSELPAETVAAIAECKRHGGKVIAVGTTSARVLESAGRITPLAAWQGLADLTICPPFPFAVVEAMVTNFHLPRSSLLLLVAGFAGTEPVRAAYHEAVRLGYRFYSYGDAMLIL